MKKYDDEQLRAIHAQGGYYLVLASPGCGKTDILSERIVQARKRGVNFEDMLCLTFTNRASRGMQERVMQKIEEDFENLFVGNVHRYCSNLLFSQSLIPENAAIIDDDDLADILVSFDAPTFMGREGQYNKYKTTLIEDIDAYIKQRQLQQPASAIYLPKDFESYYQIAQQADFNPQNVPAVHSMVKYALMYRQYKSRQNLLSFSDILIDAYEHLRHDTTHQFKRYSWIQVDEVQDLNALQTAIIDCLLDTTQDFTVMYLGDEQQAIFSFLGAKLGQLDLLKDKCKDHILTLGQNYRSPKYLLDVFNTYATEELGVPDEILPQSSYNSTNEKLDLILAENNTTQDEVKRVSKMIQHYLQFDGERVAILVPTNTSADRVSKQLIEEGIEHFKISGRDIFKSRAYKTLSSFWGTAINEFNMLAWARLLYGMGIMPTSVMAQTFVEALKDRMLTPGDLLRDKPYFQHFYEEYLHKEFVFFDTETTGLNVFEDDIVQIAAFKVRNGQRVPQSDFNIFLHTDQDIPAKLGELDNPLHEAYHLHSHYDRAEGLQLFIDYVGSCPILGHNVNYDYQILQHNVSRTLNRTIHYDIYDSLYLIKYAEPNLKKYKLAYLLQTLQLEGCNSHLADEDIAATKSLVDYCCQKFVQVLPEQEAFLNRPKLKNIICKLSILQPLYQDFHAHLYQPISVTQRSLSDQISHTYHAFVNLSLIDEIDTKKFDLFLQYVRSEWETHDIHDTLYTQFYTHSTDMTAGITEGDLIHANRLMQDRVFIMTVYKGKGLEFENVIVLESNDGTYPYYMANKVLNAPYRYTQQEVLRAQQECKEDARKFYVALTRAKKRICVSFSHRNSFNFITRLTPFMKTIEQYFYSGR